MVSWVEAIQNKISSVKKKMGEDVTGLEEPGILRVKSIDGQPDIIVKL